MSYRNDADVRDKKRIEAKFDSLCTRIVKTYESECLSMTFDEKSALEATFEILKALSPRYRETGKLFV